MSKRFVLVVLALALLCSPIAGVAAAQENTTSTPAPTPTATPAPDGDDGNATDTGGTDRLDAILAVTQSPYESSAPEVLENEQGSQVYRVHGKYVWLTPENFAASDVQDVYISSNSAAISYEESTDRFLVAAQADGTYTVTFQVAEDYTVQEGSQSVTKTRQKTYRAIVQVEDSASTVVSGDELQSLRDSADRWDQFTREIKGIFGESVNVVQQTNAALEFLKFKANPVQYALESPISAVTVLFFSLGGWMILAVALGLFAVAMKAVIAYVRREERMAGVRRVVEDMSDRIDSEHIRQDLSGADVHDAYADPSVGDTVRRALGNADSVWDAVLYLVGIFDTGTLVRDRLRIMGAAGYAYQATRNDDGDVTDVRVKPEDEFQLNARALEDVEDDVIEWICAESPNDHAVWQYNLRDAPEVEFDTEIQIENDVESVLERLGQMVRTPGQKRRRIQMFAELLVYVQKHPHTDSAGRIKGLRWVISGLTQLTDHIADRKGVPNVKVLSEHLYLLQSTYREEMDIDKEINAVQNSDLDVRGEE